MTPRRPRPKRTKPARLTCIASRRPKSIGLPSTKSRPLSHNVTTPMAPPTDMAARSISTAGDQRRACLRISRPLIPNAAPRPTTPSAKTASPVQVGRTGNQRSSKPTATKIAAVKSSRWGHGGLVVTPSLRSANGELNNQPSLANAFRAELERRVGPAPGLQEGVARHSSAAVWVCGVGLGPVTVVNCQVMRPALPLRV